MVRKPKTPDGTRIYTIGDVHGRLDLLQELHQDITRDMAEKPMPRGVLVHLGDYVDRGPASRQVIDYLIERPLSGFETVNLKGNHEDFIVRFHDSGDLGESWLMNGGGATLASYGVAGADDTFDALWRLDAIRAEFLECLPQSHLVFFRGLALHHREGDYLFVHAGLRPGVALEQQSAEDRMWIRDEFLFSEFDFGPMVIHGHTPRPAPVLRANRIGIDTMAYRTGCLTCLVLEGENRRFIST